MALMYAKYILNGRFIEAESYISQDNEALKKYIHHTQQQLSEDIHNKMLALNF